MLLESDCPHGHLYPFHLKTAELSSADSGGSCPYVSLPTCLVHWREHEGVVVTVLAAVAGDLADIVDRVGVDQGPTGFGGDQRIQVTHSV